MIDRFVLLIGAMKAGTTALFRLLEQHPEIAACSQKEPNRLCDPAAWREPLEAYASLWTIDPARHRWALEASTAYAKLPVRPSAACATWRMPAEFRFVYMVRDPIARIRSQYLHSLAEGWIEAPIHRRLDANAVLFSNYRFQLAPYVATHGRESVLVLSYEDFRERPLDAARRVCAFLGVDASFAFHDPGPQNDSAAYRAKLRLRALERRGATAPLQLAAPVQRVPAHDCPALAARLARGLAPDLAAEIDAEIEAAITPSPAQIERVHALLDADLALFRDEWGIDPWRAERAPASLDTRCDAGSAALAPSGASLA